MSRLSYKTQTILILFGFLTVPLILLITFSYYPALNLILLSFTDWDGLSPDKNWVGLDNYRQVFSDPEIFSSFRTNAYYFVGGLIQVAAALYFAVILNGKVKGRNLFRAILFMPYVLHSVAIAYMFQSLFHAEFGTLNLLLGKLGLTALQRNWLSDPHLVNYCLAFVSMWKYMGLNMIVFIGVLQSIPESLYEAAKIDGASPMQSFWHITVPSIRSVLELNLILTLTGALSAFDIPFVMTRGANDTMTFIYKTVDVAFKFSQFGLASAMAVILLLLVLMFIGLQRKLIGREEA